jgi:hypothetical protein
MVAAVIPRAAVRRSLLVCTWLLLLLPARAMAGEGERTFSLGVDLTRWTIIQDLPGDEDSVTARGGGLAMDYAYGWSDDVWLRASAAGGYYFLPDGTGLAAGGTVGVTYALDVLRFVPVLELGVGGLWVSGDGIESELKPVVELGIGVHVLRSRGTSWGVVARFDSFASQAVFLTLGARFTWRWGYF